MCASCLEQIRREHYPDDERGFALCGCAECEALASMLVSLKEANASVPGAKVVLLRILVREVERGGTH